MHGPKYLSHRVEVFVVDTPVVFVLTHPKERSIFQATLKLLDQAYDLGHLDAPSRGEFTASAVPKPDCTARRPVRVDEATQSGDTGGRVESQGV